MPTVEEQLGTLNNAVAALAAAVGVSQTTMNANVATAGGSATAASNSAAAANTARTDTQVLRDAMQTLSSGISAIALAAGSGPATSLQYPAMPGALLTTAADIVDGVTYDVRGDTDGGTWSSRRSDASWWRATLGTATRGARREFPKVVDIVLRSGTTGTLTIFDRTDLDVSSVPRMWMVIARSTGGIIDGTPRAVFASQGRVFVSTSLGLFTLDFPNDTATWADNTGIRRARGGISTFISWGPAVASSALVSADINHSHARVLPGAEIDAAGLQIPTAAVATPSGASVIHPNGQVWDITGLAINRVRINDNFTLTTSLSSTDSNFATGPIPYADVAWSAWLVERINAVRSPGNLANLTGGVNALSENAVAQGNGLTFLARDFGNPSGGMVAYAATNFATGWQPGDCRLASFCDATSGNITGSGELIANGAFTTDLTGWTKTTAGTSDVTWSAGVASFLGDGTNEVTFDQSFTTVIGQTYLIPFDIGINSLTGQVGTSQGGGQLVASATYPVGRNFFNFTATTTTTWIRFRRTAATTATLDNVSCQLAIPDRSYRGRGLIVNGTVGRAAVNSGDVVGFSGFSGSNFFSQPYNPDLDFGTGDFAFAAWFRNTASGGDVDILFERGEYTGSYTSTPGYRCSFSDTSGFVFSFSTNGFSSTTAISSGASVVDGQWHLAVVVRRSGVAEMWIDGVRVSTGSTGAIPTTMTNTGATLRVGVRHDGVWGMNQGAASMLRFVNGYAPTPAQIRRMFRDEVRLFDTGVRCTLGGTSNAVQKMAFDDSSNTLIVGTGDGVSEFNGLVRTGYFDTSNVPGLTNDNMQAVGGAAGFRLFAGTAQAVARRDPTNGIDTMYRYGPRAPFRDGVGRSAGRTTDATPLNLSPRLFVGEREHVRGEVTVVGKMVGATATQRFSTRLEFVATRDAGGNVTLNLAAASQKDPLWNGTAAIDGTVETTSTTDAGVVVDTASQTLALQVTGIAATTMAWTADWTFSRIAEDSAYAA